MADPEDEALTHAALREVARSARIMERQRCADIVTKYRKQAADVNDPDQRDAIMLVLNFIRAEITYGRQ